MKKLITYRAFSVYFLFIAVLYSYLILGILDGIGEVLLFLECLFINLLLTTRILKESAKVLTRICPFIYIYTVIAVYSQAESTLIILETCLLPVLFILERKYKIMYRFL